MFRALVSWSNNPDTERAAATVLDNLDRQLDGDRPGAGLLFCGMDFDHPTLLARIRGRYPGIQLIGSAGYGAMGSGLGFGDHVVVLMLLAGDDLQFAAGVGRHLSQGLESAVDDALAVRRRLNGSPRLCLTLPENLHGAVSAVAGRMGALLGPEVAVLGGGAGAHLGLGRSWQFYNDEVLHDAVPVLLIGGPLLVGHGLASGWCPLGRRGRITAVEGEQVQHIDKRPALDFYRSCAPDPSRPYAHPLAVFDVAEDDAVYLRLPLLGNLASGHLRFVGELPPGAEVQCTAANADDVVAAALDAVGKARAMYPGDSPQAALLFSCGARRKFLGPRTGEEFTAATVGLAGLPSAGLYSAGQIAPLRPGGAPRFHHTSFVALLLGER